jgi:hypothetical protein
MVRDKRSGWNLQKGKCNSDTFTRTGCAEISNRKKERKKERKKVHCTVEKKK